MTTHDKPHNAPHDDPKPDPPARRETPADPAVPPIVEYPKMLYHADGSTKTVASKDEAAAATKDGYQDTPVSPEKPHGKTA